MQQQWRSVPAALSCPDGVDNGQAWKDTIAAVLGVRVVDRDGERVYLHKVRTTLH